MQIQYLEIVTPDVEALCKTYEAAYGVEFGEPVLQLGGARVANLADGGRVGVRAPMHETEEPTIRPYGLVDDIQAAWNAAIEAGAEPAHPPMQLPEQGTFAIFILGGTQHGLWQL